jgi:hypothetical protein
MAQVRAHNVRQSLLSIINSLPSDGLTTDNIIDTLHKHHAEAITSDSDDLIRIALVRLVNQVGDLRSGSTTDLQIELFEEYKVNKRLVIIVETPTGPKKVWKNREDMTIGEVTRYVEAHERPRLKLSGNARELSRMLDDVKAFSTSDDDKIAEVLAAAHAARKSTG